MVPDHGLVDKPGAELPVRRGRVEDVPDVDTAHRDPLVDLLAEKDVLLGLVAVDEVELGFVGRVPDDVLGDLEEGRDARAAADEAKARHVHLALLELDLAGGKVVDLAEGAADVKRVADLEGVKVLRQLAAFREPRGALEVHLDDKVKVADLLVGGRGRVGSGHHLAVDVGAHEHVLAEREAEDVLVRLETESEPASIVAQLLSLDQLERNPLLRVERNAIVFHHLLLHLGGGGALVEVADVVVLEQSPGLGRVNSLKLFGSVATGLEHDALSTTRMLIEVLCAVIHAVPHDDPHVLFGVVLLDLLHREELPVRHELLLLLHDLRHHRLLPLHSKPRAPLGAVRTVHPATDGGPRDGGVLELDEAAGLGVDLDAVYGVVAHAHDVPGEERGLGVGGLVPAADHDFLGAGDLLVGGFEGPEGPAPVFAVFGGVDVLEFGELPDVAAVEGDFDAGDAVAVAGVAVAFHGVFGAGGDGEGVIVARVDDSGVDVELVEKVFGGVPPSVFVRDLLVNLGGEDAVVEEVVVVVRLLVSDDNLGDPLDHAAADPAGDEHAERVAVVGLEELAVLLESKHDVVSGVQRLGEREGCAVVSLRKNVGALHADVVASGFVDAVHAGLEEDVAEHNAGPEGGGSSSGAPVETDSLLRHVLFLAAVSSTGEGDGEGVLGVLHDVVHGEDQGLVHEALNGEAVLLPLDLRDFGVVADEVELGGGTGEAVAVEELGGRLDVEGVAASQADETRVAVDPFVGRVLVAVIGAGGLGDGGDGGVILDRGDGKGGVHRVGARDDRGFGRRVGSHKLRR
mmetsp:Transcript_19929/g.49491  ORF Transcript_19929/g.49491 Transcript_19929/m.49491 type:complete len:799 (+) Transcript_19929:251-2647(+)